MSSTATVNRVSGMSRPAVQFSIAPGASGMTGACSAQDARTLLENPPASAPVGRPLGGVIVSAAAPSRPAASTPPFPTGGQEAALDRLLDGLPGLSGTSLVVAMQNAAAFGESSVVYGKVGYDRMPMPTAFALGNIIGLVRDEEAIDALVSIIEDNESNTLFLAYEAVRALAAINSDRVAAALEDLARRKPESSYVHDVAVSALALMRTPDLYSADPASFDDELIRTIFAPWDELVRLDRSTLRALAQPLEHLWELGVLGSDNTSQTVWRVVRAERRRQFEESPVEGSC